MKTKARPRAALRRTLEVSGRVVGQEDGGWIVRAGSRRLCARRAASCLLAPRADDEVTVVLLEDGRAFVTAVLERPEEAGPSHLLVPGDAVLHAGGTLTLSAREAHTFAERVVTCASTRVAAISGADQVEAGELELVARGGARLHAREALITADAVVKIDSDQVHVG